MGKNQQPESANEKRPIRAIKAKGIAKSSEALNIQNEEEIQMRLEDKRQQESKRAKTENHSYDD